jgi:hypothetical protein
MISPLTREGLINPSGSAPYKQASESDAFFRIADNDYLESPCLLLAPVLPIDCEVAKNGLSSVAIPACSP